VMRVVRQAHVVAAQFLGPGQRLQRIGLAVGAPAVQRGLVVDRDAAQEDRPAIEQDLGAADLDAPEADVLAQRLMAGLHDHLVELWRCRRPQAQARRVDLEPRMALGIHRDRPGQAQLGDADRHRLADGRAVQLHRTGQRLRRAGLQLQHMVADEDGGLLDQRHVLRDAAIVPPVGAGGGHGIRAPAVVGLDHQEVALWLEQACDLEVEGREAALVVAQLDAVEVDLGTLVDRAEVHEVALAGWRRHDVERPLQPYRALVVQQLGVLRVPVARHLQRG